MGKAGTFFSGMKSGMITMLNASGSALVSMYDTGAFAVNRTRTVLLPTEKAKIERQIKELSTKIVALQYEIGKESARFSDQADAVEALELRANIARLKDCERELEQLNQRLTEIAAAKEAARAEKKAKKASRKKTTPGAAEKKQPTDSLAISEALLVIPLEEEATSTTTENMASVQPECSDTTTVPADGEAEACECTPQSCCK